MSHVEIKMYLKAVLFANMAGCSLCLCTADAADPFSLIGTWVVSDSNCKNCQGRDPDIGRKLVISNDLIKDPFSGGCDSPSFFSLKSISIRYIDKEKINKEWLKNIKLDSMALSGYISCHNMNYAKISLLSNDKLLYFWENDNILLFTRILEPFPAGETQDTSGEN